jgi:chemotaxis protein methyltransferase CheR
MIARDELREATAAISDMASQCGLSLANFDYFRGQAMRLAGITLPDYKRSMVQRRLSKRLAALRLPDFESYIALLEGEGAAAEMQAFINALTTNKTEFFREPHHFEHLRRVTLPEHRMRSATTGNRRFRVWSAGCSSGQEPWTIAITIAETLPDWTQRDLRVLATDIDTDMTRVAHEGVYAVGDVEGVPATSLRQYFEPLDRGSLRIGDELRPMVRFNQLNLHNDWPMTGLFDVVFCRNVIIYFDKPTQTRLFDRFAAQMHMGGYLYIGHSETLYKVSERFEPVGQSIYRKVA